MQTLGVVDTRLTGRLELAVADRATIEFTGWEPTVVKLIVCCVLPVPTPLSRIVCVPTILSELSVRESEPLELPEVEGVKLIGN